MDKRSHNEVESLDRIARAIRRLAIAAECMVHEGRLSEADLRLLSATLAASELITVKFERVAAALKRLDERT